MSIEHIILKKEIVKNRLLNPFLNHKINSKYIDDLLYKAGNINIERLSLRNKIKLVRKLEISLNLLADYEKVKKIEITKNQQINIKSYIYINCPFAIDRCSSNKNECSDNLQKSENPKRKYYCVYMNMFLSENSPFKIDR